MALKPYTFTAGTKARASEVNANFDDLYTEVNSLERGMIDCKSQIQHLQNTKADTSGSYLNTFAVANPTSNYDAVNKQYLQNATANSVTYINGLGITKVGDATISVNAGSCYDSTNAQLLVLENSLEKQNTTQEPGSVYYVYLIGKSTGNEDILISRMSTNPDRPEGYSYYRRIGSYTTDSDNKILKINVEQLSQYPGGDSLLKQNSEAMLSMMSPDLSSSVDIGSGWVSTSAGWIYASRSGDNFGATLNANGVPILYEGSFGGYSNLVMSSLVYVDKGMNITFSHYSCKFYKCKGVS